MLASNFGLVYAPDLTKAPTDPTPGMKKKPSNPMPAGASFDGYIQGMGFRFTTPKSVR